jgi:hypothetical protein
LAVEAMDVIRYMNSVLFLCMVIKYVDDIALNRIGTHQLENYFGTVRLASNDDHSWNRFMSATSKGILCSEIMTINGLKKPSVRDFSVGGVKIGDQQVDDDKLRIDDLLEHGMDFVNLLDGGRFEDDSLMVSLWVEDLMTLSEWKRERYAQPICKPGPVASDTALSGIIAFRPDAVAFQWTKRKRTEAVRFWIVAKWITRRLRVYSDAKLRTFEFSWNAGLCQTIHKGSAQHNGNDQHDRDST